MNILFSVVIPLYNKRCFIKRAVVSVLNQKYQHFELIVIDDGSTDGSVEQLSVLDDRRLQVISQINQGVGSARNNGMKRAKGQWIAFLDADDEWLPDHLITLIEIIRTYPSSGLISNRCIEIDAHSRPKIFETPLHLQQIDYFRCASKSVGFINSTSVAIKAEVTQTLGGFLTHKRGEDLEYWARVALHYPVAISSRVTSFYYRDTQGVMSEPADKVITKQPLIRQLSDISPSVKLVYEFLQQQDSDLVSRVSLVAYINSRLDSLIIQNLYAKNLNGLHALKSLYLKPLERRSILLTALISMPTVTLGVLIDCYRLTQKIKRSLKR